MKEITLIMWLLINGQESQEKVKMSVQDKQFIIQAESFTDTLKYVHWYNGNRSTKDWSERVRIWEGKENYVRMVTNKSGIVVFAGAKKGKSIVLKTR